MKKVYLMIVFIIIFTACSKDDYTIEKCKNQGYKIKYEKKLNYRTGKYELKATC